MTLRAQLARIVGGERVCDAPALPETHPQDSTPKPWLVVSPAASQQVQQVVRLCARHQVPLVPSSSGVHSHGTPLPRDGGIVLDLRRMDRVLAVDPENRVVRVEPGVTWGRLQEHLEGYGLRGLIPLLPHPQKSALTSTLEREPMLIPRFEYGEPLLTLEVVFGTGEVLRTGAACVGEGGIAQGVQPEGPGLDFFRLLQGAQGTMGVVTWATLKVEHLPRTDRVFFFALDAPEGAVALLYRLGRLMLGHECLLLNRLNLALILAREPKKELEGVLGRLPPWALLVVLSGAPRRPQESVAYQEEALLNMATELGMEPLGSLPGASGAELPRRLRRPWDGEGYWRFNYRGACQDLCFITTLEKAPEMVATLRGVAGKAWEGVGVYLQPLEQGRACHLEFNFYHRESKAERQAANTLSRAAAQAVLDRGALFTRPYGFLAGLVYPQAQDYTAALKKVKALLDPSDILAPGRLCF